jgi:hypothetical protein
MRNRRDRRGLKPAKKALHSHSTAISRGQIDDLRQGGSRAAQVAAPSAPSPRPMRPTPECGRQGTRARAWRCWGLAQSAYKWLKSAGLGAGACCVHCVAPAPSATPPPPTRPQNTAGHRVNALGHLPCSLQGPSEQTLIPGALPD